MILVVRVGYGRWCAHIWIIQLGWIIHRIIITFIFDYICGFRLMFFVFSIFLGWLPVIQWTFPWGFSSISFCFVFSYFRLVSIRVATDIYLVCFVWFVVGASIVLFVNEMSLLCSFDARLSDFEPLRGSFTFSTFFSSLISLLSLVFSLPSLSLDFFDGPRRRGGGAFDEQHWQYHLPRGTLINGGM